jgi:hypothetical protein
MTAQELKTSYLKSKGIDAMQPLLEAILIDTCQNYLNGGVKVNVIGNPLDDLSLINILFKNTIPVLQNFLINVFQNNANDTITLQYQGQTFLIEKSDAFLTLRLD